jgi:hypothetical protein
MNDLSAIFILYVASQERSRHFYAEILQRSPVLDVSGMTEFRLSDNTLLGLMPAEGISRIISPPLKNPAMGNGIPRCELYLYVTEPTFHYNLALGCGGISVSEEQSRSWGDTVAYCADPDGHVIAFARKNN